MASIIPAAVRASGFGPTTGPVVRRMLVSLITGAGVLACTLASAAPAQAKTTVTVEAPTSVAAHHGYWVQASGMRVHVFSGAHGTRLLYRAVLMDARTHRITDTSTYGGQPPVLVRVR